MSMCKGGRPNGLRETQRIRSKQVFIRENQFVRALTPATARATKGRASAARRMRMRVTNVVATLM
jgi:hypothetical protein